MIVIDVVTEVNKIPVSTLQAINHRGAEEALLKKLSKDEYKKLLGDEKARVHVGIHNTIGAPHFSSVKVQVYSEVTCDQDAATMKKARDLLFDESVELLPTYVEPAYLTLLEQLKTLPLQEDDG